MFKKLILILLLLGLVEPRGTEAKDLFPFSGELNFETGEYTFAIDTLQAKPVLINVVAEDKGQYLLSINIDHWQTPLFILSTYVEIKVGFNHQQDGTIDAIKGEVVSNYSLINYRPAEEVMGVFEIRKKTLYIQSLNQGGMLSKGFIQLYPPFKMEFFVRLLNMDINDFLAYFVERGLLNAGGLVNGDIVVSGDIKQPVVKGNLLSLDGFVDGLEYRSFVLKAEGKYPLLDISGSNILQTDGLVFNLSGAFDLGAKANYGQQISNLLKQPVISSDREKNEWTLKRFNLDRHSGTTELKYLHKEEKGTGAWDAEDSGMIGVENKFKF